MVVGIHSKIFADYSPLLSYITVNGLFRLAVPIFFIINGFYFYNSIIGGRVQSWFFRCFALYLCWMIIYSPFWVYSPAGDFSSPSRIAINFFVGYKHLWYLPGMLGAAFVLYFVRNKSMSLTLLLATLLYFSGVLIQYLGNYNFFKNYVILDKIFNEHWVHRNFLLFGFPLFFVGYCVNKFSLDGKISLKANIFLVIVFTCFLLLESYINFSDERRSGGFDNYISLIFLAPLVFSLFQKIKINFGGKYVALIAASIYFAHMIFVDIFEKYFNISETWLGFLVLLASLAISPILIIINARVKYIL